jgi:hypothetical protein
MHKFLSPLRKVQYPPIPHEREAIQTIYITQNKPKSRCAVIRISTIIPGESQRTCQKALLYLVQGIVFVEMRMFQEKKIKAIIPSEKLYYPL